MSTVLNDGQFLVGRALGAGGFGVTYRAWDQTFRIRVAIKEYFPRQLAVRTSDGPALVVDPADQNVFANGLRRFLDEARRVAQFRDHPNIVRVRHFFSEHGTGYLVMDYYDGQTLAQYASDREGRLRRLGEREAVELMLPVLEGLHECHEQNLLHRDVKPDNIFLSRRKQAIVPVLLDFGAAREVVIRGSRAPIRTPGFAPWEQYYERGPQGPWTDVYACAATLYLLTTGHIPPDGLERKHQDECAPPERLVSTLSPRFCEAVKTGLSVDPRNRPQTTGAFRASLKAAIDAPVRPAPTPSPPRNPDPSIHRQPRPKPPAPPARPAEPVAQEPRVSLRIEVPKVPTNVTVADFPVHLKLDGLLVASANATKASGFDLVTSPGSHDLEIASPRFMWLGKVKLWHSRHYSLTLGAGGAFVARLTYRWTGTFAVAVHSANAAPASVAVPSRGGFRSLSGVAWYVVVFSALFGVGALIRLTEEVIRVPNKTPWVALRVIAVSGGAIFAVSEARKGVSVRGYVSTFVAALVGLFIDAVNEFVYFPAFTMCGLIPLVIDARAAGPPPSLIEKPAAPAVNDLDSHIEFTVRQEQIDREESIKVSAPDGRRIEVRLRKPMRDGVRLRLKGQANGGKGDLYVALHVIE